MREGVGAFKGTVGETVLADFPRLRLWSMSTGVPHWASTPELRDRIAQLEDRVRGAATGALRTHGILRTYRSFARQLGLDPDVERNPLEVAAMERLTSGRYVTAGAAHDAVLVGMLETGIPMWVVDARDVHGFLSVEALADGRVAVCDESGPIAGLMEDPPPARLVTKQSERATVWALAVGTVPSTSVEEAFWHVRTCLGTIGVR